MKPLFTIHAGEFVVGNEIERRFRKQLNLWVPTKDEGIDFLVTDRLNRRSLSLQVKYSRDYLSPDFRATFGKRLISCGWWVLDADKLIQSNADYWILLIVGTEMPATQFVIIPPKVLLRIIRKIRPNTKRTQTHLWINDDNKCWDTMGMNEVEKRGSVEKGLTDKSRDFSKYLNNWRPLEKLSAATSSAAAAPMMINRE